MLLKGGQLGSDWPRKYLQLGRDYAGSGRLKLYFDALNTLQLDTDDVLQGALRTFTLFDTSEDAAWEFIH